MGQASVLSLDPELAATGGSRQSCRKLPSSTSQEPEMRWLRSNHDAVAWLRAYVKPSDSRSRVTRR